MPTQNVNLTDRNAAFVHRQVKSGLFKNISEVHRAALVEMERQEEIRQAKLSRLRAALKKGDDDLEAGRYNDFDSTEELSQFMEEVLAEVLNEDALDAESA